VTRLLVDTMQGHGIDIEGAVLLNASGLSRKSRLSARQLGQTLHALYSHSEWSYEAMASMAIFGRDGTVSNRLKSSPAKDSVRAKTGSMSGVGAIAGVAHTQAGEDLIFVLLVNELGPSSVSAVWDQMIDALVKTCPQGAP
jgi:D-alanyl-D-alanine carboxypeptidase/D-alanyl-D-alanine-endopeptidase (penicillin-binding protein 4)